MKAFRQNLLALLPVVCICCFQANAAKAQNQNSIFPNYSYSYVADQTSYQLAPGASMTIPLYLQEVSTAGNSLLTSENGLTEAAVDAAVTTSPSDPAIMTNLVGNALFAYDPSVTSITTNISGTDSSVSEFTNPQNATGVTSTVFPSAGISEVLLGNLTIQAGNTPGQTTVFTLGAVPLGNDGGPIGHTFTFANNYDLDANNDPYFGGGSLYSSALATTFSVTTTGGVAAPLPPTAWLVILALPMVYLSTRRRLAVR